MATLAAEKAKRIRISRRIRTPRVTLTSKRLECFNKLLKQISGFWMSWKRSGCLKQVAHPASAGRDNNNAGKIGAPCVEASTQSELSQRQS